MCVVFKPVVLKVGPQDQQAAPGSVLDMQILSPLWQPRDPPLGNHFAVKALFLAHRMSIISALNPGLLGGVAEIALDSWRSWCAELTSLLSSPAPL